MRPKPGAGGLPSGLSAKPIPEGSDQGQGMTKTDIATRVYNHTWKLDPIIRSLIDTDFYKLLMLQMIWKLHPDVNATFSLINRTSRVRLAEEIDEGALRDQQYLLWPKADLRAGIPELAVYLQASGIRAVQAGRPV
jgi:hypothetical protein